MNTRNTYLTLILVLNAAALSGRAQETNRMYIPFIDESSQSNVVVTVQELFSEGIPCPLQYTNVIDNTNLFTSQERNLLEKVLVKYAHITTNSGPPGSVFVSLKNAIFTNIYYLNKANSVLRSTFRYTNADATETVTFVERGFNADFRPRDGDGYYLGFLDQIHSLGLRFVQNKNGIPNGLDIQSNTACRKPRINKRTRGSNPPNHFILFIHCLVCTT
jgi:hypothetical protein